VLPPGRRFWRVVVAIAFAKTTVLFANAGETTSLPPFVDGLGDPVDSGVATNSFVIRVHQNNLVIFVDSILVDPIRIQHSQISTPPTNSFFGNTPETTLRLEVVHTLAHGFTVCSTLWNVLFAVTPPYADTVDDISLLGLVSQLPSLVRTRWTRRAVDDIQLTVFPATHTKKESKNIRLFLFVKLANIFIRTHAAARVKISSIHIDKTNPSFPEHDSSPQSIDNAVRILEIGSQVLKDLPGVD